MRKMAKTFPFIPAVLCGGSGSRLWPRSRAALPKPFIAMPDGGGALIDRAYARIARAPVRPDAVMTIVSADYGFLCEESFAAHGPDVPHWIVAEPIARDTAPATAMAAEICRQRLGDNAVLLVLPADHMIDDADGFWKSALRRWNPRRRASFRFWASRRIMPRPDTDIFNAAKKSARDCFPSANLWKNRSGRGRRRF